MKHPAISPQLRSVLQEIILQDEYFDEFMEQVDIQDGMMSIGAGVYQIVDFECCVVLTYNPFTNELTYAGIGYDR